MYSQFSRCGTARGSSTVFSRFSPTKVEAPKCSLFTESSLVLNLLNLLYNKHYTPKLLPCHSLQWVTNKAAAKIHSHEYQAVPPPE